MTLGKNSLNHELVNKVCFPFSFLNQFNCSGFNLHVQLLHSLLCQNGQIQVRRMSYVLI